MFSLLLLGFIIGMRHALEADHVAAVASLTANNDTIKGAIKLGSIWGLGHTITLFFFGSIVLLTDFFIPDIMAKWLEFVVGVMLVLLGFDVLRRLIRERIHFHVHRHSVQEPSVAERHFHAHSHINDVAKTDSHQHEHRHSDKLTLRALFIGVLHGMAGSAALILLTLETIESPLQGVAYIMLFGLGSVVGMAVLSFIISIPLRASARGMTWMHNGLQFIIGAATIVLGSVVVYDNSYTLYQGLH